MECIYGMKKRQESNVVARFWTKQPEECILFVCLFYKMETTVGEANLGRK